MAESESGQDKTEDPTDKRKRESREKGEVPRSKELNTLVVMMAGSIGLISWGGSIAQMLMDLMRTNFSLPREVLMDPSTMGTYFMAAGKAAFLAVEPMLVVLMIATLLGPIALGGFLFSAETMMPKFSRMNPLPGLKRMFSSKALIELGKAIAKFSVILVVAISVLSADRDSIVAMAHEPIRSAIIHSVELVARSALYISCGLILIAAVDAPIQLYEGRQKLLMTKQEVRDEHKDSEGRPEVKGRIRQLQREMSQRRMMLAIPEADVVITNPTHYAVALKYDQSKGNAPVVVAKGADFMALKIREIAGQHQILLLQSPELARAVYFSTEIDHEIPAGLYLAVAQVLAYVYQLRQYRAGKAKRPGPLDDLPIPPDLRVP